MLLFVRWHYWTFINMQIASWCYRMYIRLIDSTLREKYAINIWQDLFRSVSVHELLWAIVFFPNGFEINLLYSQLSLNKHLFRRRILWCWPLSLSSHLTVPMLSVRRKPLKDGQPTLLKPSTDREMLQVVKNTAKRECTCTTSQYKLQLG